MKYNNLKLIENLLQVILDRIITSKVLRSPKEFKDFSEIVITIEDLIIIRSTYEIVKLNFYLNTDTFFFNDKFTYLNNSLNLTENNSITFNTSTKFIKGIESTLSTSIPIKLKLNERIFNE